MHDLFLILFRLSCLVLIVGMISPLYPIYWMPIKSRARVAAVYGPMVFVFLLLSIFTIPKQVTSTEAVSSNAPLDIAASASLNSPEEQKFIDTITKFAADYKKSTSVVDRNKIWANREAAIAELKIMGQKVTGWSGRIKQSGLTPEGMAVVVLALDGDITIRTNKDGFSDAQDHTLISQDSDIYSNILKLNNGQQVKFSGTLLKNSDTNEVNSMMKPTYIMKFETIEAQ
ncbi:MAG: hypothetical protein P4M12_03580 [Gammaproteobacteria bacterium]|nr:hypothetical protein [Gammaproteobacteria bacterium]